MHITKSFGKKYKKIQHYDKYIKRINDCEKKRREFNIYNELLKKKVAHAKKRQEKHNKNLLDELNLQYNVEGHGKVLMNGYTKLFDAFMIVKLHDYGLYLDNMQSFYKIKRDILRSKLFQN